MDVKVDAPSAQVVAGAKRAKDLVGPKGLKELFPTKIKLDPNGRKHQWEWVALLPFMDERQLELVLDCVSDTFDASERDRNRQTRALAGAGAVAGGWGEALVAGLARAARGAAPTETNRKPDNHEER